ADLPLLHERADTEAADAGRRDGEVTFLGGVESARLLVVHDRTNQDRSLLRREHALGLRTNLAVDLDRGREAGGDEQVRALAVDDALEQVLHQLDSLFAFHFAPST